MHHASNGGHLDIVKFLFDQPGIEKEPLNKNNKTPLHLAAQQGHLSVVQFLFSQGANPNCKDEEENTPCHYAS